MSRSKATGCAQLLVLAEPASVIPPLTHEYLLHIMWWVWRKGGCCEEL